jgi:hypothetical protein
MSARNHADQPAEGAPDDAGRSAPSRRSVLHGAAGLAGAGLAATAMAGTLAAPAAASAGAPRAHPGTAAVPDAGEPVIVHVRDPRSGEMDVYAGEAKASFRDPALAARLARAVR